MKFGRPVFIYLAVRIRPYGLISIRRASKSYFEIECLTGSNAVYGCYGNDEAVFARARSLHFTEQLLLHRVHQLGPEVSGMQHDLVLQRYVVEHF